MTNHGIERERNHHTNGDSLRASLGIEDLSGDDPGEGTAGEGETDLVEPVDDNEGPPETIFARGRSVRETCDSGSDDHETHAVDGVTDDQRPATTEFVDEQHSAELGNNGEHITNRLILQRIRNPNVHLCIYLRTEILDS